ncbi:MAG: flagellar hook-basal body complex protein FliE [Chloroflexota bacterium]|nr:MAG: flagellar hook-basal body complex protein FliE [Chloroflexota bacterium]
MSIAPIGGLNPLTPGTTAKAIGGKTQGSFGQMLSDALTRLNGMQQQADAATTKLATGQPVELHDVMIAVQEASLAFDLTLQVRNKLIDAYQEVMRTSV